MAEPDPVSIPSDCTELNENLPFRDGSETNEPYGSVLSERKQPKLISQFQLPELFLMK